jgi:hypothetical protein
MNHPHPDELLLFASGELADSRANDVASHVEKCAPCQDVLAQFDQALGALGGVWRPARSSRPLIRPVVWGGVALAAAAALAVVFTRPSPAPSSSNAGWAPTNTWSRTAGYVAGGTALLDIDAQLTRLEQERNYVRP